MPVDSVTSVSSLIGFVDYVRDGEALGALILAIAATLAWIFNKYYAYLYWRHTKDIEVIENLIALNTEITQNAQSYLRNFNLRTYRRALTNARAMASSRKRQPMITAEEGENAVFNSIKSRLTILPTDIIEPVIAYYTKEAEFSASYSSLSNPTLAKRHIEITLSMIRTTHLDAIKCIKQGKVTVKKNRGENPRIGKRHSSSNCIARRVWFSGDRGYACDSQMVTAIALRVWARRVS